MKVAHLTSVHARYDTRIFLKQCRSLAKAGYDVSLVVADGLGNETRDGVRIADVGKSVGRVGRMLGATRRVLTRALEIDADVYQLHDPELLPVGLSLKRRGKRVIFDSHEDVPQQILSKPYLHPIARRVASGLMNRFEIYACHRFDHVLAATPFIRDKFLRHGIECADINNFPMLGELESDAGWSEKKREVCYVGGMARIRGATELVRAIGLCQSGARLNFAGPIQGSELAASLRQMREWKQVDEKGFLNREEVRGVLAHAMAGVVTFLPLPNHIDAQPNKMFEYMSAGVPVIASHFPLWREIVEGNECGICIDPQKPEEIAAAIDYLVENPETARRMGESGRKAVYDRYNWGKEEEKLLALYRSLKA